MKGTKEGHQERKGITLKEARISRKERYNGRTSRNKGYQGRREGHHERK
jgi:hypothetical protein